MGEQTAFELTEGVYTEGRDIQAGMYSFRCDAVDSGYCILATFENDDVYQNFIAKESIMDGLRSCAKRYEFMKRGEKCTVDIERSSVLLIKYGSGLLILERAATEPEENKPATAKLSYDDLLLTLQSTELTSGEKLMARIRYWADNQYNERRYEHRH